MSVWRRWPHASGALVGGALTAVGFLLWPTPPPPPAPATEPEPATVPAPRPSAYSEETERLTDRVRELETRLAAATEAQRRGADPLAAAHMRLETALRETQDALASERAMRREREGEGVPFPPELDDAYRQSALMSAFDESIAEAGVHAEVGAIDCLEYPCIVHGEIFASLEDDAAMDSTFRSFTEALRRRYPEASADMMVHWRSVTSRGEGEEARNHLFSIVVSPRDAEGDRGAVAKRVRHRMKQYAESVPGGSH